jgi:hypothetical protein
MHERELEVINVSTLTPHELPADNTIQILARAHRGAWAQLVLTGETESAEQAEALAQCLSIVPAKTKEGLAAKAAVIRSRLIDSTIAELIVEAGPDSADCALVLSFATDALDQLGE